jgi:hypothetical protein
VRSEQGLKVRIQVARSIATLAGGGFALIHRKRGPALQWLDAGVGTLAVAESRPVFS